VAAASLDSAPAFRRRFRITPGAGRVRSEVEDDFHCMAVTLSHRDGVIVSVEAEMDRAPWTTCPGAVAQVEQTFAGVALAVAAARGEKTENCTHLYDLAVLAAAHAADEEPLVYDVIVADPQGGRRGIELRRNGALAMSWVEENGRFTEPQELAGLSLRNIRPWIDALDARQQEEARLLRWAAMIAIGRVMPLDQQSDATQLPPNCYTFQPDRRTHARRVGEIRDFSVGNAIPLDRRPAPVLEARAGDPSMTPTRQPGDRP
jgi:hypothetical protein